MSNTPKTTAIDWLISKLPKLPPDIIPDEEWPGIIGEAREMDKAQKIEAYYAGTAQFDNAAPIVNPKTPQDYYNQTYGKSE
jgi:hypothetical protein